VVNDDMADQSRADGFRDIGGVGVVPTGVFAVVFCFAAGAVALPVVPTIGPISGRTRSVSSFGHRRRVLATAGPAWTSVVSAPDARQSGTVPRYVPADGHRGHGGVGVRAGAGEFERNFVARGEVGAACCVYRGGEPVVDLVGRYHDRGRRCALHRSRPAAGGVRDQGSARDRRPPAGRVRRDRPGRARRHYGLGGSVGFAHLGRGFTFGYAVNQMGPGTPADRRSVPLVDAVVRCCSTGT